jgi:hypothetical protein
MPSEPLSLLISTLPDDRPIPRELARYTGLGVPRSLCRSPLSTMSQSSKICPECRLLAFDPAKVVHVDCVESTKWEDYGAVPLKYVLEDTYPAISKPRHGRKKYGCVICRFLGRVIWSYLLASPHLKTSASVDLKLELSEYHPQLGSVKFGNSLLPGNIRGRITINGEENPIRIETRNSSQGTLPNPSTAFPLVEKTLMLSRLSQSILWH